MRIYTRQGDKGLTRLADGTSLAKDDKRVETYGAIDDVFALGMQAYLSNFLGDIGAIGQSIHAAYLEVL